MRKVEAVMKMFVTKDRKSIGKADGGEITGQIAGEPSVQELSAFPICLCPAET